MKSYRIVSMNCYTYISCRESVQLPFLHCPADFGKSDDLELKLCTSHGEKAHLISKTSYKYFASKRHAKSYLQTQWAYKSRSCTASQGQGHQQRRATATSICLNSLLGSSGSALTAPKHRQPATTPADLEAILL